MTAFGRGELVNRCSRLVTAAGLMAVGVQPTVVTLALDIFPEVDKNNDIIDNTWLVVSKYDSHIILNRGRAH